MASPVGHALAGVLIYELLEQDRRGLVGQIREDSGIWKRLLPYVFFPNLPDVDFLVGYLFYGDPHLLHFGITHTLGFVLLVALLAAPFRFLGSALRTGMVTGLLVGSHLIVDISCGDPMMGERSIGMMLFYPFSSMPVHSPWVLFWGVRHQTWRALFSFHNLLAMIWEAVFSSLSSCSLR
jgi:inner membrane protein